VTRMGLACLAALVACSATCTAEPPVRPGLLFHASFDRADSRADFALGDPAPRTAYEVSHEPSGKFGGAVKVEAGKGILAFDATGNVLVPRGTMAFWARVDTPLWAARSGSTELLLVSGGQGGRPERHFIEFRVDSQTKGLKLRSIDSRRAGISLPWKVEPDWAVGSWRHIAIVWDAALGRRVYFDGRRVAEQWGSAQDHRFPALDKLSLASQAYRAHQTPNTVGFTFDELWVFDHVLSDAQIGQLMTENRPPAQRNPVDTESHEARARWVREHFSLDAPGVPECAVALEAKLMHVDRLRDVRMDLRNPMDGKAITAWPVEYKGYSTGGKELRLECEEPAEFNYVRAQGRLKGRLTADGKTVATLPGAPFVQRVSLDRSATARLATVQRDDGRLHQLDLFRLSTGEPPLAPQGRQFWPSPASSHEALGEPGRRILACYPTEDRIALLGLGQANAATALAIEACRFYHVVTEPMAADAEIGKVALDLRLQGFPDPTTMVVQVHDPVTWTRELLEFDLRVRASPGEPHRVTLALDGLGLFVEKGKRVWLSLLFDQPGKLLCGPERTRLVLASLPPPQRGRHITGLERILCDEFLFNSEAGRWRAYSSYDRNPRAQYGGVGEVMTLCEHLLHFDARNPTAASVYSWMLQWRDRWDSQVAAGYRDPLADVALDPPKVTGPDWAVWGREALKRLRQHVDWWVNERSVETGELGSNYEDDTDLVNDFVNFSLIHDPGDRTKDALRRLADYTWEKHLTNGLSRVLMDHLHAFEEGTNIQHALAILYYGHPEYVERLMTISRAYETHLTGVDPAGRRFFRSNDFSATAVGAPQKRLDQGKILIFQPGRYLVWYNGNPIVLRALRAWQDAWLLLAAEERAQGRPTPEGPDGLPHHLYWLYRMTGDERYREPVAQNLRAGIQFDLGNWSEWRKLAPDEPADAGAREILAGKGASAYAYLRWKLGADRSVFLESLKASALHIKKYLPVHTWVGQSADRVATPQADTARMFLGGQADQAKRLGYHYHAVSWEGADDDVARLVVDNTPRGLKTLLYSFHERPQTVVMRVWQLDHGRYRVRAGADTSGNEEIGKAALDEEMTLLRHSPIALTVPPRQVLVVTVQQLARLADIRTRPDLAIGPKDVALTEGRLTVTVHNIGGADAPASSAELLSEGKVVAQKPVPALPAPTDLTPKTATIVFEQVRALRDARVRIVPPEATTEITTANNEVTPFSSRR